MTCSGRSWNIYRYSSRSWRMYPLQRSIMEHMPPAVVDPGAYTPYSGRSWSIYPLQRPILEHIPPTPVDPGAWMVSALVRPRLGLWVRFPYLLRQPLPASSEQRLGNPRLEQTSKLLARSCICKDFKMLPMFRIRPNSRQFPVPEHHVPPTFHKGLGDSGSRNSQLVWAGYRVPPMLHKDSGDPGEGLR